VRSPTNAPQAEEVVAAALRLRAALDENCPPIENVAAAIAETCRELGSIERGRGRATVAAIAARWGWSVSSLPLDLICAPWTGFDEVRAFARTLQPRRELIGFIIPANLPGAGLHELAAAVLAGCAAMVKTAAAEPIFFDEFALTLAAIDAALGARIAVFNWSRDRADLTAAMSAHCDRIVAFGDDGTIAHLAPADAYGSDQTSRRLANFAGFGARVSGIVVTGAAIHDTETNALAETIAREASVFEQRGCLSPHHLFVGDAARNFAQWIAAALDRLAGGSLLPPPTLALEDAAAIRRARETARWRALAGQPVQLWEGVIPGWTVVYDRDAVFTASPGFRTIYISPFSDPADLARRLAPVAGRIEAVGFKAATIDSAAYVAALRDVIARAGASWVCDPGRMQSPPVDWPHGGGEFIRLLRSR
jgi:hypothetical protein